MKAYTLLAGAGFAGLHQAEAEPRPLGPSDVRVAVRAAALNDRGLQFARGQYPNTPPHPPVPLSGGVGDVIETGPAVTRRVRVRRRARAAYDHLEAGRAMGKIVVGIG